MKRHLETVWRYRKSIILQILIIFNISTLSFFYVEALVTNGGSNRIFIFGILTAGNFWGLYENTKSIARRFEWETSAQLRRNGNMNHSPNPHPFRNGFRCQRQNQADSR